MRVEAFGVALLTGVRFGGLVAVAAPPSFSLAAAAAAARDRGVPVVGTTFLGVAPPPPVVVLEVMLELLARPILAAEGGRGDVTELVGLTPRAPFVSLVREFDGDILGADGAVRALRAGEEDVEAAGLVVVDDTRGLVLARKEAVGVKTVAGERGTVMDWRGALVGVEVAAAFAGFDGDGSGSSAVAVSASSSVTLMGKGKGAEESSTGGGGEESSREGGTESRPDSTAGDEGCESPSRVMGDERDSTEAERE